MRAIVTVIIDVWCIVIFFCPILAEEGVVMFSTDKTEAMTLSLPSQQEEFLQMLSGLAYFKEADAYREAPPGKQIPISVNGFKTDVNHDEIPDIFLVGACGKRVCGIELLDGNTLKRLGYFEGSKLSILTKHLINDYAIISTWGGTGQGEYTESWYHYTGKLYELKYSKEYVTDPETGEIREVVPPKKDCIQENSEEW